MLYEVITSSLYKKGDGEATIQLVAYVVHSGTSTNVPVKNVKVHMKWTQDGKGYDIVTKVV